MAAYHIKRNGKLYGPFSVEQVAKCINTNIFTAKDTISGDSINWDTIEEFQKKSNISSFGAGGSGNNTPYGGVGGSGNNTPYGGAYGGAYGSGNGIQPVPAYGGAVPVAQAIPANCKSRRAYIMWAYFLGGLGIHDFYAGRALFGVIKLLLTLFGFSFISQIWCWIDIFTVTTDGNGEPLYWTPAKKSVFILLCVLCGIGGAHYFYAGYLKRGLAIALGNFLFLLIGIGVTALLVVPLGVSLEMAPETLLVLSVGGCGLIYLVFYITLIILACRTQVDSEGNEFI